jgi:hypothetical protein
MKLISCHLLQNGQLILVRIQLKGTKLIKKQDNIREPNPLIIRPLLDQRKFNNFSSISFTIAEKIRSIM